jgi:hypothetical protein
MAVICAGRPPSLRKESKVDKLMHEAREKKKKAEQREKKKAAQKEKKKSEQEVFLPIFFCQNIYISSNGWEPTTPSLALPWRGARAPSLRPAMEEPAAPLLRLP